MKFFKNIANFFTTKTNTAVKRALSAEDQYTKAATIIIDKIDSLRKADVNSTAEVAKLKKSIKEHRGHAATVEESIRISLANGQTVPQAKYVLALQRNKIADALEAKIESLEGMKVNIAVKVVELDDKLEEIKANLEVIRLTEETDKLGIQMPEDVNRIADIAMIDVDTIMTEVETFIGNTSNVSVNPDDLSVYMAKFK